MSTPIGDKIDRNNLTVDARNGFSSKAFGRIFSFISKEDVKTCTTFIKGISPSLEQLDNQEFQEFKSSLTSTIDVAASKFLVLARIYCELEKAINKENKVERDVRLWRCCCDELFPINLELALKILEIFPNELYKNLAGSEMVEKLVEKKDFDKAEEIEKNITSLIFENASLRDRKTQQGIVLV